MNGTSYSSINTYQRCPKKAYYRMVMDIQPKRRATALFNGINGHEFLKVFFLGLQAGETKEEAWSAVIDAASYLTAEARKYTFDDELLDAEKEIDSMLQIIKRYIDQYVEDWEILHVEEEFLILLDSGRVITFTPDLVVRDRNGFVWIIDHKTTSGLPEGGLPFGDTQALLYYAGVKSLYPETRGFIFNRIRKKIPTQPRLTKTGKVRVADLARIDTTYEVLRDWLKENAPALLSDPAHQRRLAELRDQPDKFFWTEQIITNDETVDNILKDVDFVLAQMETSAKVGHYPRNLQENHSYMSCSKCPYRSLCKAELLGWDVQPLLEEDFEPADPKNPYEGEIV